MTRSGLRSAVPLVLWCAVAAAQEPLTFSTGVEVIRVDVLVTADGRPVPGLKPEDFEVRDQGVLQELALVQPDEPSLNVILALDASASVAGEPLEDLRRAGRALLDRLEPGDQAAVITFSDQATVEETLAPDLDRIGRALSRVEPSGETAAIDAIYAALLLAEGELDRDVVIVFSDGVDTSSWLTDRQVLEAARHAEVVVYGVTVEGAERPDLLQELAELTGGSLLDVGSTRELDAAFVAVLDELRQRYLLSYVPRGVARGGWHEVDVRLKGRRAQVRARTGYMAPSDAPTAEEHPPPENASDRR